MTVHEKWSFQCFALKTLMFLCLIACGTVLQLWPNKKGSQAPVTAFWSSSISNAIGPACGIVALKYISYPAQVFA